MSAQLPIKKIVPMARREPAHPILEPRLDDAYWWERKGVFNPGVTEYKDQILLLYRAYDDSLKSRIGLAHCHDGINFNRYDHRLIDINFEDPYERLGLEDPRITKIEDTYYIVHTSASHDVTGQRSDIPHMHKFIPWRIRIGMHTTKDFHSFEHWKILLPHAPAKNASLLPEKIDGQFGMYYREFLGDDEILKLTFTTDFSHWSEAITIIPPPPEAWWVEKIGFGSQPIAVKDGFLMVYHGVDQQNIYRLGLMLFDRDDPAKIRWYSNYILEPKMIYEKIGTVPNAVYCCGALIRGAELWIYYGAADRVIGRAVVSLKNVLGT